MLKDKKKILIADDSEINRSILSDMLKDEFEIIEAEDGRQAVSALQKYGEEISIVLLDIVMPEMDGFEVLELMKIHRWIDNIPVIMITAENNPQFVEKAYDLGVTDFISRPFDCRIVHRRTVNTIMLYLKQKKLISLVTDQMYEKEKQSNLLIEILSNIVEFRNGESGLHVLRIHMLTDILLNRLQRKTNKYKFSREQIALISIASALHDIGKIAIPEYILNKPGKLTKDEFDIMKTHAAAGALMLSKLAYRQDEPLVKTAYEICRWHHERYDGRGYPDGLMGDAIPISAQVVSIADVYDALVSKRVYKDAYTHDKALEMISSGECGKFNPILVECLEESSEIIKREFTVNLISEFNKIQFRNISQEMVLHEELFASERSLMLVERERTKYQFFASMSKEIQFEYNSESNILTLTEAGAIQLNLPELIVKPLEDKNLARIFKYEDLYNICTSMKNVTIDSPVKQFVCEVNLDGEYHWFKIIARAMWSSEDNPYYLGVIGKIVDITEEHNKLKNLGHQPHYDGLTGLLNRSWAEVVVNNSLDSSPNQSYAAIVADLDNFKQYNKEKGHNEGDAVISRIANLIKTTLYPNELAARIGGDSFLLLIPANEDIEERIVSIYNSLAKDANKNGFSISIGAVLSNKLYNDFTTLVYKANQALKSAKKKQSEKYSIYDDTMKNIFTNNDPID